jgi:glycogen debranching enzyme
MKRLLSIIFVIFIAELNAFGVRLDGLNFYNPLPLAEAESKNIYDASILSPYGSHFGIKISNKRHVGIDELVCFHSQGRPLPLIANPLSLHIDIEGKKISFKDSKITYIDRGYKKLFKHNLLILENIVQYIGLDELKNVITITNRSKQNVKLHLDLLVNSFQFALKANQQTIPTNLLSIEKNTVTINSEIISKYPLVYSLDHKFSEPQINGVFAVAKSEVEVAPEASITIENSVKMQYSERENYANRYDLDFSILPDIEEKLKSQDNILLKNSIHTLENALWAPINNYKNSYNSFTSVSTKYGYPLMIPWDSAFNAIGYSKFLSNPTIPQSILTTILNNACYNFLIPNVIFEDRSKNTCDVSNPPMLAYTVMLIFKKYQDINFLKESYPKLVNIISFWEKNRDKDSDGLFEYNTEKINIGEDEKQRLTMYESAWDDNRKFLPKYNGGYKAYEIAPVELNSLIYSEYIALSAMACLLKKMADCDQYLNKAETLKLKMNKFMKDPSLGIYLDVSNKTREKINYLTPHIFFPLFAKVADEATAKVLIQKYLLNKSLFWPTLPTIAFNQKGYDEAGSFYGPIWLQIYYFVYQGVENYNTQHQYDIVLSDMRAFLRKLHKHNNNIFYERYNSNPLSKNSLNGLTGIAKTNYGWSAATTLSILFSNQSIN